MRARTQTGTQTGWSACLRILLIGGTSFGSGCGQVLSSDPAPLFGVPLEVNGEPVGPAILDTGGGYEVMLRSAFDLRVIDEVEVLAFAGQEVVDVVERFSYRVGDWEVTADRAIVGLSVCDCNGLGFLFFRKTGAVLELDFTEPGADFVREVPRGGVTIAFVPPPEHLPGFESAFIEVEVVPSGRPASDRNQAGVQTLRSAQRTLQPAQQTLRAAQRTLQPAQQTLRSAQRTLQPAQQTLRAAQRTLQPAQQTLQPAQQTLRSAQRTLRPASTRRQTQPGDARQVLALLDTGTSATVMRRGLVAAPPLLGPASVSVTLTHPALGSVTARAGLFDTPDLPDIILGTDVMQAWADRWYFAFTPQGGYVKVLARHASAGRFRSPSNTSTFKPATVSATR